MRPPLSTMSPGSKYTAMMHYSHPVYRPPFEANSLLLQVSVGCSHNDCAFCSMYRHVRFRVEPIAQIEQDLIEARNLFPHVPRVFLVSGDPFGLNTERLAEIARLVHHHLPEVETIAMYGSVPNIAAKSNADLRLLRSLRINDINIGLESGLDSVLSTMNKRFTLDEALYQTQRLRDAGFAYSMNIILGAGGRELSRHHALASAEAVNRMQPHLVFVATLHLEEDCPLQVQGLQGRFVENSVGEMIEEEVLFLDKLQLVHSRFYGLHPSNTIPVDGWLPADKRQLIARLRDGLRALPPNLLQQPNTQLVSGGEGAISLRDCLD